MAHIRRLALIQADVSLFWMDSPEEIPSFPASAGPGWPLLGVRLRPGGCSLKNADECQRGTHLFKYYCIMQQIVPVFYDEARTGSGSLPVTVMLDSADLEGISL